MPIRLGACASLLIVVLAACAAAQVRTDVPTAAAEPEQVARELELLRAEIQRQGERDTSSRADWLMVAITGVAAIGALVTLLVLRQQTKAAVSSAHAAENTATAAMLAERAYVEIAHTPEGLLIAEPTDVGHRLTLTLHIKNHGRTPADVFSVILGEMLGPAGQRLPETPPYGESVEVSGGMFLMPGKRVRITVTALRPLSTEQYRALRAGALVLVLVARVDYSDRFGRKHRNGYARRFDHTAAPGSNNLVFVTQRGYNYDRELNDREVPRSS